MSARDGTVLRTLAPLSGAPGEGFIFGGGRFVAGRTGASTWELRRVSDGATHMTIDGARLVRADKRYVVAVPWKGGMFRMWETATATLVAEWDAPEEPLRSVVLGETDLVATGPSGIWIWPLDDLKSRRLVEVPADGHLVYDDAQLGPGGRSAVVMRRSEFDNSCTIVDLTGETADWSERKLKARWVTYSPDGSLVSFADETGPDRVFEARVPYREIEPKAWGLAWAPKEPGRFVDTEHVVTAGAQVSKKPLAGKVDRAFAVHGDALLHGQRDQEKGGYTVQLSRLSDWQTKNLGHFPEEPIEVLVDQHGGERRWVLRGLNGAVALFTESRRVESFAFGSARNAIYAVHSISPDGGSVLLETHRWELAQWDRFAETVVPIPGALRHEYDPRFEPRWRDQPALAGDGGLAVFLSSNRVLKAWDVEKQQIVGTMSLNSDARERLHFRVHPTQRSVVLYGDESQPAFWNLGSGASPRLEPPLQVAEGVQDAVFSRDGKHLLLIGEGGRAWLLDGADGANRRPLLGHRWYVTAAQFDDSGDVLATADSAGVVALWDTASGKRLCADRLASFPIWRMALSGDGTRLTIGPWRRGFESRERVFDLTRVAALAEPTIDRASFARTALERVMAYGGAHTEEARLRAAEILSAAGRTDEALALCRETLRNPSLMGRMDAGLLGLIRDASETDTENVALRCDLAIALAREDGSFDAARDLCKSIRDDDLRHPDDRRALALALYHLARRAMENEIALLKRAEALLASLRETRATNRRHYYLLALILDQRSSTEDQTLRFRRIWAASRTGLRTTFAGTSDLDSLDVWTSALRPDALFSFSFWHLDRDHLPDAAMVAAARAARPVLASDHWVLAAIEYLGGIGAKRTRRFSAAESHARAALDHLRAIGRDGAPETHERFLRLARGQTRILLAECLERDPNRRKQAASEARDVFQELTEEGEGVLDPEGRPARIGEWAARARCVVLLGRPWNGVVPQFNDYVRDVVQHIEKDIGRERSPFMSERDALRVLRLVSLAQAAFSESTWVYSWQLSRARDLWASVSPELELLAEAADDARPDLAEVLRGERVAMLDGAAPTVDAECARWRAERFWAFRDRGRAAARGTTPEIRALAESDLEAALSEASQFQGDAVPSRRDIAAVQLAYARAFARRVTWDAGEPDEIQRVPAVFRAAVDSARGLTRAHPEDGAAVRLLDSALSSYWQACSRHDQAPEAASALDELIEHRRRRWERAGQPGDGVDLAEALLSRGRAVEAGDVLTGMDRGTLSPPVRLRWTRGHAAAKALREDAESGTAPAGMLVIDAVGELRVGDVIFATEARSALGWEWWTRTEREAVPVERGSETVRIDLEPARLPAVLPFLGRN